MAAAASVVSFPRGAHTASPRDEGLIAAFIESCVKFESNVVFAGGPVAAAADGAAVPDVLFLSKADAASAPGTFAALAPKYWAGAAADIYAATKGKDFVTTAVVGGAAQAVTFKAISGVASRHNCPVRPDLVTAAVKAAVASGRPLLVVVDASLAGKSLLAVAQAIAKGANRSFSAKKGKWDAGHFEAGHAVAVHFPAELMSAERAAACGVVARNIQLCMRLVDAPTNLLDTDTFTEIATQIVADLATAGHPVRPSTVIRGEELREKGYGGLYGVGKAAEFPPALVALSYKPHGDSAEAEAERLALVGKGIVYDTGGLAIKNPATSMCTMKCDMGGSAAVFCGFLTAVQLRVPRHVDCVLCLADNALGPRSFRNDDILILKSGLSIEINNTDAEGRLVLSDGVYHASAEMGATPPKVVMDMATLTGAQGFATGQAHAAIFTDSEDWETAMVGAGRSCGDVCFPIVHCPEFHLPQFSSKVADFRNHVRAGNDASVSCAGQFIANSLPKGFGGSFVHVDLAGPAFREEVATGYGVALLAEILAPATFAA